MGTKELIYAAVLSVALLGCATPAAPPGTRTNCSSDCTVRVHVANCAITDPKSADVIDVHGSGRVITWQIDNDSHDYSFPDSTSSPGVWIKDPGQGQFTPTRLNQWMFKMKDENTVKGTFKYGIRVMKGTTACPDFDPSIVNN